MASGIPFTAFRASRQALAVDFEEYQDALDFTGEYQLTAEPMRIDAVLIKKDPAAVIGNPIAGIFKRHNLFEYKSPTDYLSVADFYKGLTYGFTYRNLTEADIQDISLTFAVSHYPRAVLEEIRRFSGYTVSAGAPGITLVSTGFGLSIQIIEPKKLSAESNLFLRHLRNDLEAHSLETMLRSADRRHNMGVDAYIDVLSRANPDILEEVLMSNKTFEQVLTDLGLIAKAEAKGETRARREEKVQFAQKLIKKGWKGEEIAETTGLDAADVNALFAEAGSQAQG